MPPFFKAGVHVKVVSERLGHSNVAFTMNVYQHVLPGMQAEAADTFSLLLNNQRDKAAAEKETEKEPKPEVDGDGSDDEAEQ